MPEIVKRTIIGAIVNVGEIQAPAVGPDGEDLGKRTVKVLHIADVDEAVETVVYLEPGTEGGLAAALTGGIVIAKPADVRGNGG